MIIQTVSKQGPCKGVLAAIKKVNNALNNQNIKRPIYMLGKLVHNRFVIEAFKNKGVIILDGTDRLKMLDEINDGTVIITAHGVSTQVYQKISNKNLGLIDATCIDVNKTKTLINKMILQDYQVIFLGVKNHPEAQGVIDSFDNIVFIDFDDDYKNFHFSKKCILITQTTLSYTEVLNVYNVLKVNNPQLKLANEICNATRSRQEALINEVVGNDLCIVVGDKSSNNSKMLAKIAKEVTNVPSILIDNIEDLNDIDFSKYHKIIVTSGSSTPLVIVQEVIEGLKHRVKPYCSNISINKYIEF